jgi:hypothetical protein
MRSFVNTVSLSLVGAFIAGSAFAGEVITLPPTKVPEPGMIGLFAAGAVAVVLLKCRNRK